MQVTGLTGVVAMAAGREHSLAVLSTGAVWAWGSNVYGQLGDGTKVNRLRPVVTVPGVAGAVQAGGVGDYSVALTG